MPVREFVDSHGVQWRAWDVTPDSIHPQTKSEDYLADCYRDGWLVFETADGSEKRRLCPIPYSWHRRSDPDLAKLLETADVVRPLRAVQRAGGIFPADLPPNVPLRAAAEIPRDERGDMDMSYLGVVRSFPYPRGRIWTVSVILFPEDEGPPVLRFQSGTRKLDLRDWPPDWLDYREAELIELLRRAGARRETPPDPDAPQRRYDDPSPTAP
jgi:hypothetical protein